MCLDTKFITMKQVITRAIAIGAFFVLSLSVSAAFNGNVNAEKKHLSLDDIIDKLKTTSQFDGSLRYGVLLPQAEDEIVYEVSAASHLVPGDHLSPINYIIEWKRGDSNGFSAYFKGSHYRYQGERLQEYHYDWDSIPFTTADGGVQRSAQFVELLPRMMGAYLHQLISLPDFSYTFSPDTLFSGRRVAILKGKLSNRGYVVREGIWVFDPSSGKLQHIEYENNPTSIAEQSITVDYSDVSGINEVPDNEAALIDRYPEIFERYRHSNFRVENMPGTMLPSFSCRQTGNDRYSYSRGEPLTAPTLIVMLDAAAEDVSRATIKAVREAASMAPADIAVIYAWQDRDLETAAEITGRLLPGESCLAGARSLATDCGANSFPTILYVDTTGKVRDVTLGFNQELRAVVIQKIQLMN